MTFAAGCRTTLLTSLLAGVKTEVEIFGPGGVFGQLIQRLVERALEVELTDRLGHEPHREPPGGAGNTRNGRSEPKTLVTERGPVQIRPPRDRNGSFGMHLPRASVLASRLGSGATHAARLAW